MNLNHRQYFELIHLKYERGEIDYGRYAFLIDKLTQWEFVYNEREDE